MRLAEARKILATPPTVLETLWWKTPQSWLEMRKITGPGSAPERWQHREHTIHGTSEWRVY